MRSVRVSWEGRGLATDRLFWQSALLVFYKIFWWVRKRTEVVSRVGPLSLTDIGEMYTYPGYQVDGAYEFCTLASSICGPSVWNLLHLKLLSARIIELSPKCLENLCNPDLDSKHYLLKPLLFCAVCESVLAPWVSHICFNFCESGNVAGIVLCVIWRVNIPPPQLSL